MIQPIFQDMLDDNNPKNVPFPQGRGDVNPAGIYHGAHLPHDGYRPEGTLFPRSPRGTYMTPKALQLAEGVADKVRYVAMNGPVIVETPPALDDGTYMTPAAVRIAQLLERRWLRQLRRTVPSQEFPLDQAV